MLPIQNNTKNFAAILLQMRLTRSVSTLTLARQAGVHRRTLIRWQKGENQPSMAELDAVLAALKATPDESAQAVASIAAPRARQRMRVESELMVRGQTVSPPVGGDLLRALRLRRYRTQQDIARALQITQATLARWESGETWPSPSALHELCWELEATPEEVTALTVGHFSPGAFREYEASRRGERTPRSFEELEARIHHLPFPLLPSGELGDLKTLAYIASLWAMGADREPRLRPYLAMAYSERARFLMDAGRLMEAESPAHIALKLLGGKMESAGDIRTYVTATLALSERDVWGNGPNGDARARIALALTPPEPGARRPKFRWGLHRVEGSLMTAAITWPYRTWALAHAARYAFGSGSGADAVRLAELAYQAIDPNDPDADQDRWARRELWMRLLVRMGRFAEVLTIPPTLSLTEIRDPNVRQTAASALLVRATALIALGNRAEAQEHIRHVEQEGNGHGWPALTAEVNSLAISF